MEDLTVEIEGFSGPLDLLLHLIQQYEMDIYQVPLAEVTDQYLAYLNTMQTLQLEVAGEYLVMAATLLAIKSRQLLPTYEDDLDLLEEEEDPTNLQEDLIQQLIEYRKYKYAANQLKIEESSRLEYFDREPADLSGFEKEPELQKNQVTTIDLFLAFHDVFQKAKNTSRGATVEKEDVSVADKVVWLKEHLFEKEKRARFSDLFLSFEKKEIVNTFLAILELMKEGFVEAQQEDNFSEIYFIKKKEIGL